MNVTLPPIIPMQLQPQVEATRADNRRAELIPQVRSGQASNTGSDVGFQQERAKSGQATSSHLSNLRCHEGQVSAGQLPLDHRFVEAAGEDRPRKQRDPHQQQQGRAQRDLGLLIGDQEQDRLTHELTELAMGGGYAALAADRVGQGLSAKGRMCGSDLMLDTREKAGNLVAPFTAEPTEGQARHASHSCGVLGTLMDQRNKVIAGHYQHRVTPAVTCVFSLYI